MKRRIGAIVLALSGIAAACQSGTSDEPKAQAEDATTLDETEWLIKAGRFLRDGQELGVDEIEAAKKLPKEQALDAMMSDPRFGDVALRFSLYFLGQSGQELHRSVFLPEFQLGLTLWPQAIAAAHAVVNGGNFYDLFSSRPRLVNIGAQPRASTMFTDAKLERSLALVPTSPMRACVEFVDWLREWDFIFEPTHAFAGGGAPESWLFPPTPEYPKTAGCRAPSGLVAYPPVDVMVSNMRYIGDALKRVERELSDNPEKPYALAGLRASESPPGLPAMNDPFAGFFNSDASRTTATNFNRKRAAWTLKTFFCDDLTPAAIPVTTEEGGARDVHASNAACQGCHYRLDPIGGLFRERGESGAGIRDNGLNLDDGTWFLGDELTDYLNHWNGPDGKPVVGYFVMGGDGKPTRDPAWLDSLPTNERGLMSFLPKSKVAQKCVTRRLAEFVFGESTLIDRDWLAEISRELVDGPESGAAFKRVLAKMLLSRTFVASDPAPGVCYDLPSGAPLNRPPCAIAQVVSNGCASCHSSAAGPGHLDFTAWNGSWWSHTDQDGKPLDVEESGRRMLDRLITNDLTRRMPLLRPLAAADLKTLRDWLGP